MITESFLITAGEAGGRLDKILSTRFSEIGSRTYFQYLIESNQVSGNGTLLKKRDKPKVNDQITIHYVPHPVTEVKPEDIPLTVVYEDSSLIVINKPAGMVVHPSIGHWTGTFVNALLFRCKDLPLDIGLLAPSSATIRPGIVHRLDKDTTGLLIGAKTLAAQQRLIEMFSKREIYKEYLAICVGNPGCGLIDEPIARDAKCRQKMAVCHQKGKQALTHFTTLKSNAHLSLVKLVIETGRTHQIRVHMQHHRTPILGDPVYGSQSQNNKFGIYRQLLHAHKLEFNHPMTSQKMTFTLQMPSDMLMFPCT